MLLVICALQAAHAQDADSALAMLKGKLINKATSNVANDVLVSMPEQKRLITTNGAGEFMFGQVPFGTHILIVGGGAIDRDTLRIQVNQSLTDIGTLTVRPNDAAISLQSIEIPAIALEDNDVNGEGDGVSTQYVNGLLTASGDPFLRTAAFIFGTYRFRPRGYEHNFQEVQINGAPLNDVETGDANWNQWGGLNDVFRARNTTYGLQSSDYTFGGINGTVNFDADAASQRRQTRVTYSLTNRQYRNRIMMTHSSGLLKSGWAYAVSSSRRWSGEGYVPGTSYDGYSYYAAVSKVIGSTHKFHFTTFGAPTRRAGVGPVTQEVSELAGTVYYNPYWGYQQGEKRNARIRQTFQPVGIFNYEFMPSSRTRWNTAIEYQSGKNRSSRIDWYNGANPAPDYYQYLPSWQYEVFRGNPAQAAIEADDIYKAWISDPSVSQINWDRLYQSNYANTETVRNIDGNNGDSLTGRRSVYVLCDDVEDIKKYAFNTSLRHAVGEHLSFFTGVTVVLQRTERYCEVADLLGGDFYINNNQFAERKYAGNPAYGQYDLNDPNRIVRVGDRYNYDYISRFNKARWWGQAVASYNRFDAFAAISYGLTAFSREGMYRHGLYQSNSYGESPMQRFTAYAVKGGFTYKMNGRHYLFLNGSIAQDPPSFDNAFVSPHTRNQVVPGIAEQRSVSFEGGYMVRSPRVNGRFVGYTTTIADRTEILRYYSDDSRFESFINYALTGISTRHSGVELALDVKLNPMFSLTGVAAIGQAIFTNNPRVGIFSDNDTSVAPVPRQVFLNRYHVGAGPQSAYSLGINYQSRRYWYANLNANYFDRNYVDIAPDRRSEAAPAGLIPGTPVWEAIFSQEKLEAAFTMDLFLGRSFRISHWIRALPHSAYLYLNIGISNLLDNKEISTGGFEQLRYNTASPGRFPNKYFYGQGRNYFINLSLKL